eukprot:11115546-Ditylum_brightwellii.AAC.1
MVAFTTTRMEKKGRCQPSATHYFQLKKEIQLGENIHTTNSVNPDDGINAADSQMHLNNN